MSQNRNCEKVCVTLNPKLAEFGLPNSNPFEEGEVAYMCPGEEGGPPVPEDPHLSYQIPDSIFAGQFYSKIYLIIANYRGWIHRCLHPLQVKGLCRWTNRSLQSTNMC